VLEAGEVMEHFQWKTKEEIEVHIRTHKEDIADELADVLHYLLILSRDLEIDLIEAEKIKMQKSALKYPVEKSKGKSTKYTYL
jgi:NTP pyrophosphatase (non-canonical NTP hydrolase)